MRFRRHLPGTYPERPVEELAEALAVLRRSELVGVHAERHRRVGVP